VERAKTLAEEESDLDPPAVAEATDTVATEGGDDASGTTPTRGPAKSAAPRKTLIRPAIPSGRAS
jgi:hypothetical protein